MPTYRFAKAWDEWYVKSPVKHDGQELPLVVVVVKKGGETKEVELQRFIAEAHGGYLYSFDTVSKRASSEEAECWNCGDYCGGLVWRMDCHSNRGKCCPDCAKIPAMFREFKGM